MAGAPPTPLLKLAPSPVVISHSRWEASLRGLMDPKCPPWSAGKRVGVDRSGSAAKAARLREPRQPRPLSRSHIVHLFPLTETNRNEGPRQGTGSERLTHHPCVWGTRSFSGLVGPNVPLPHGRHWTPLPPTPIILPSARRAHVATVSRPSPTATGGRRSARGVSRPQPAAMLNSL